LQTLPSNYDVADQFRTAQPGRKLKACGNAVGRGLERSVALFSAAGIFAGSLIERLNLSKG